MSQAGPAFAVARKAGTPARAGGSEEDTRGPGLSRPDAGHRTEPEPGCYEPTEAGQQRLIAGLVPISPADRLRLRAAAPLLPAKPQRPCDLGLFDLAARNQLDLFTKLPPGRPDG